MVITAATPATAFRTAPTRAAASLLPGDSVSLSRNQSKALITGACCATGAGLGGWAISHFTSGLAGTAGSVVGGLGGAVTIGLVGAVAGAFIASRGKSGLGFEGLAAAYGGALVGGGVGVVAGAIGGALLGTGGGNLLAIGAGAVGGALVGGIFAKGLTGRD